MLSAWGRFVTEAEVVVIEAVQCCSAVEPGVSEAEAPTLRAARGGRAAQEWVRANMGVWGEPTAPIRCAQGAPGEDRSPTALPFPPHGEAERSHTGGWLAAP